ncbi:MAG: hypothetical protein SFY67_10970 [Candidatus Melainabacteria bacterium]|nr:hypothetical protein [Candidatus Melainabacteria bacterium]
MKSTPYTVNYKRAGDLFPSPSTVPGSQIIDWDLKESGLTKLIDWLDQEKFTGVLKASSNNIKFRGALLLFAGWCVGAVYARDGEEPIKHTHKALPSLLKQLSMVDVNSAVLQIYSLPDEVVLPFSSAFIGQFMEPAKEGNPNQLAAHFIEHVKDLPRHSLISIRTLSEFGSELCLVFFYWGKLIGHFLVEEQKFSDSSIFPDYVFDKVLEAKIHLSILSPEIEGVYSGSTRFGFPLLMSEQPR